MSNRERQGHVDERCVIEHWALLTPLRPAILTIHPASSQAHSTVNCLDMCLISPIPVAAPSKAWVCGRSLAGVAGSIPSGDIYSCCEYFVLSCRGLCDGPITRLEDSYRM